MGWTSNPAELLGLDEKGAIRTGALADLVVLDDHGRVAATFINGEMVYQAPWADFQIPLNS